MTPPLTPTACHLRGHDSIPLATAGKVPQGGLDGSGGTCKEGRGLSQSWEQGRPGRLWTCPGQKQSQGATPQGIPVDLQADGRPQDPELSGAASAQICTSRKNTRGVIPDFASVLVPKAIRAPEMASRVLRGPPRLRNAQPRLFWVRPFGPSWRI